MKRIFAKKSFKVLITTICILLIVALVTAGNSSVGNFMTSFIFTPLQQVVTGGSNAVGKVASSKSNEQLQREVSDLKAENRKLNDMLVDYYDVKEKNEQLSKYYDIKKENQDFSILPSTVIERDPNENFYGFTLDKGSVDGVKVDDPVMTENGLVGLVYEVAAKSCKVKTILSPDTQVGADDKKTSDTGVVIGSPEFSDDGMTLMKNISAKNTMKVGDIVVTSGFGGIYPKNIKIGKISKIDFDKYSGMPQAVIKPFEDIKTISSAAIIVDFSGKGEITENSQSSESSDKTSKQNSQSSKS